MVVSVFHASDPVPAYQTHPLSGIPRSTPLGFSKLRLDGREWRLFASTVRGQFVVAAQPADVRNRAARRITLRSLLPSLGALPLAALMIWIAVAYGLRPLVRITQDLRKRSHRDLLPLDVSRLPPDIAPLAEALNDLMGRLAGIIATQRTFIADAAHELLTPLTALRLQAQMLARSKSPSRQREAMAELQGGVPRTLQLARQLLTLARHDADGELADQDGGRSGDRHPAGVIDPFAARDREGTANARSEFNKVPSSSVTRRHSRFSSRISSTIRSSTRSATAACSISLRAAPPRELS